MASALSQAPDTVLLAGATGYVGQVVARQLVAAGHRVVALVRSRECDLPGCEIVETRITDQSALMAALDGVSFDAVISCIASRSGAPADAWEVEYRANQHLLAAAMVAGAAHFVLLSAICVQRPRLAFQHAKLAFEAELTTADIEHTIVRPTAFFKSLSGQVERVRSGKPFLVFGDGTNTACKPISEADLADYLITCLTDRARRNRVLPIGGPGDAITAREQGQLLFELTGQRPRFREIPPSLFLAASAMLTPIGRLIPAVAAKAEFARIGHYYATESMLVWDEVNECYDADRTPSTGTMTLREHYQRILKQGIAGHEAGEHKLF